MKEYDAYTLEDFYNIIDDKPFGNNGLSMPIWFRGHEFNYYNLQPSMQRDFLPKVNSNNTNSQLTLREFMRYQNFSARTTHFLNSDISSKLEWQEVYQHHLGKTRMMDWSESARTALSFALEAYLTPKTSLDLDNKRRISTPVVWMLNPQKLNEKVYEFFSSNSGRKIAKCAFSDICLDDKEINDILDNMCFNKSIYFSMNENNSKLDDTSISGILSLCALDDFRTANISRLTNLVKTMEFNPFYYLCLRYYSDALPTEINIGVDDILPPLAILQPYHSERIRAQRGVFTIFPNYILNGEAKEAYTISKYDARKMENQKYVQDCLVKINILNPVGIAKSLILSGERRSELYPDIDVYTELIESEKFYI